MDNTVQEIVEVIKGSDNIVFFGGAGISTESGIPDFRSVDGLYNQQYKYPPETILSATFFRKEPAEFYRFYKDKCLRPMINAKPCDTHIALANLEREGKLKAIVTQNIDDLHHRAGSKNILELHGTSFKNHCTRCGKTYTVEQILDDERDIFRCECGGIVRPDIVLYEEGLDQKTIMQSIEAIAHADCLIVAGTSLVVYPAAGLIDYYEGHKLVLLNKTPVPQESRADFVYHGKAGDVFKYFV